MGWFASTVTKGRRLSASNARRREIVAAHLRREILGGESGIARREDRDAARGSRAELRVRDHVARAKPLQKDHSRRFEGLPGGRVLYPAVFVRIGPARFRVLQHYMEPHVGFVVRTRMLCQAGRARTAEARGDTVAWLCVHAPLWVVVRVCALLRDD